MGIDLGVIIALVSAAGGLIVWIINEVRNKSKNKMELERRISLIENTMSLNKTGDANLKEIVQETKVTVKDLESRIRDVEIKLAGARC